MIGDTSLLVAHLRRQALATAFLEQQTDVAVPFVVAAELLVGGRRATNAGVESARVADLLAAFPILWPDRETLDAFADLTDRLRRAGTPIGVHDTRIAALASQFAVPIVTTDADFDAVEGVTRIDWRTARLP